MEKIPVMRLKDILAKLVIVRPGADQQVGVQHPVSRSPGPDPIGEPMTAPAVSFRGEPVAALKRILKRPRPAVDLEQKGVALETDAMAHMQGRRLGHGFQAAKNRFPMKIGDGVDAFCPDPGDAGQKPEMPQPAVYL